MRSCLLAVSLFGLSAILVHAGAEGSWIKKSYAVNGTWALEQAGERWVLVLSDDF